MPDHEAYVIIRNRQAGADYPRFRARTGNGIMRPSPWDFYQAALRKSFFVGCKSSRQRACPKAPKRRRKTQMDPREPARDPRVSTARLSVFSNSILMVLKLFVGMVTGSVSVVSEALHSGLDLVAALIAFLSVRQAAKPPDETHRYGHGKIENVSGVIEAILIFVAAVWIIVEAIRRLIRGGAVASVGYGIVIMAFSAVVNLVISEILFRVARKTESIALEADALHLRTDVYTSIGVVAGLGLLRVTGLHVLDPLVALGVAALIIKAAWELTMAAFRPLLDAALPKDEESQIIAAIQEHSADFIEFHKLRARRAGAERHVDLHLVVHRDQAVAEVHRLCDEIEAAIRRRFPQTDVLIHMEPCGDDCPRCSVTAEAAAGVRGSGKEAIPSIRA